MYELASEDVAKSAEALIHKNHTHLIDAKITILFRETEWKRGDGCTILGKASKRNEIDQLLSERKEDFIIILVKPTWEKMKIEERDALLDHELCHCGIMITNSGDNKWIIRDHPIQEFPENLARFEHLRKRLGELIQNPPSPISVKEAKSRKLRPEIESTHEIPDSDTVAE
jgi:hypothetical protein